MPRPMSPEREREREYTELHGFLDFVSTHAHGIDPADPVHPTNVGETVVAKFGKSRALEGLRQAVNDTIEMLRNQSLAYVQALDAALRERQLITLSEVRRRYAASYKRVLKRGKIKTETEYYLIAGLLADGSSQLTEAERLQLESLATAYHGDA